MQVTKIDATTENMKFLHFRPYFTKLQKLGLLTKHFAKGKTVEAAALVKPKGGASIGYVIKDARTIWVAGTVCGRKDLFNRKRAISIIRGRFSKGQYDTIAVDTKDKDKVFKALSAFALG